jgi:hypothetical protein
MGTLRLNHFKAELAGDNPTVKAISLTGEEKKGATQRVCRKNHF